MKILSMVSTSGINGAVIYARDVNRLLAARGHEILLACLPTSPLVAEPLPAGVTLLPTSLRWRSLAEVRRVARICREAGVQVIHSHLTRANNFAALLHVLHRFPSVAHAHANHFQFHYWFHNRVIAVSADTLRRHRARLSALGKRGVLLPNFVDSARFHPADGRPDGLRALLGVSADTPVVVQIGNLHRRKGQDLTRAAAELVWRQHPETHFAFLGTGVMPAAWAPDARVRWLGMRADIDELLPHASVSVLPSRDEPLGLAALESMACGVPLIAAAVGGLRELSDKGRALQVPRENVGALAAALQRALSDSVLRVELTAAGLARVHEQHAPLAHVLALEAHLAAVATPAQER